MARISASERERVRRALLETAAEVFAENGLAAASVDQISIRAGFAKGTIYNYFQSKEMLFGEVLAEGARRSAERANAAGSGDGRVRDRLLALARADVEVLKESEGFFKVVIRESLGFQSKTYPLLLKELGPYLGAVTEAIEAGVAGGEIRSDPPAGRLALVFVGILSLCFVQHWGSQGAWPAADEIPELAVSTFLEGALVR